MSKIKANVLTNRKGTTLTLGKSGTTVQLATGAINGINKETDWQTTPKTADFTAEAGKGYFLDTTSNTITVTLPASPSIGDQVAVIDYTGTFDTNAGVLDPNGKKIQGSTDGVGLTTALRSVVLVYSSEAEGWLVFKAGDSTPLVPPTITFDTAAGSLGTLTDAQRSDPNGNLDPVTATTTFGTLSYSVQSGSLPSGLTLNSSTGAFVGTADQVASDTTSNFTIRATLDLGNTLDRSFSITVQQPESFVAATGGTVTTCGDFKTHVFTGPGTFCVSCAGGDPGSNSVEYIVVAGGGSGGGDRGGGGGAGGLRNNFPSPSTAGLSVSAQAYPITVGGGGSGVGDNTRGNSGSNSIFSSITSAAGGGGGTITGSGGGPTAPGLNGGSGGGAAMNFTAGTGNTPPVTPPQGNNGANNPAPLAPDNRAGGGGGGGHSCAGSQGGPTSGGTGGAGTQFPSAIVPDSYGSPARFFAGGGGGGRDTRSPGSPGPGGNGGGTAGSPTPGSKSSNSPNNSGGGSGGGANDGQGSGNGGSGIVIIRYKYQ